MALVYMNDCTEVVVNKLTNLAAPVVSKQISDGWYSGMTTGKLVGLNTSFQMIDADARASVFIPAVGALVLSSQQSASVAGLTMTREFKFGDAYDRDIAVQFVGGPTLVNGPVWLSSGGGITQNYPDNTGDLRQQVGWATASDTYIVSVHQAATIGRNP